MPDSDQSRIVIPVKVVGGKPVYFFGGDFPELRDGAIGELVLNRSSVKDPEAVGQLSASESVAIKESGTKLYVEVNVKRDHPPILRPDELGEFISFHGNGLVIIQLEEDLCLTVRATKRALLRPCRVKVPTLESVFGSLNEAYSNISRSFESWRRSSAGNVFHKVHYHAGLEDRLGGARPVFKPLDHLRSQFEVDFERRVFAESESYGRAHNSKPTQDTLFGSENATS